MGYNGIRFPDEDTNYASCSHHWKLTEDTGNFLNAISGNIPFQFFTGTYDRTAVGVDGDCFPIRNCYTLIKELNALHEVTRGVWLCKHSALWDIQNDEKCHTTLKGSSTKVRIKLNVNRAISPQLKGI